MRRLGGGTMRWMGSLALVALALACGRGSTPGADGSPSGGIPVDPAPTAPPGGDSLERPPPSVQVPTEPCGGLLTLRLKATEANLAETVSIAVTGVDVARGGALLPAIWAAAGTASFPVEGAYRMAVLAAPDGDGTVDATFRLGAVQVCSGGSCAELGSCGAPLQFSFDPAKVRADNCHVVVELSLAGSLPGGAAFLPTFSVHY